MPESQYFEGIDIKSATGELLSSVDVADTEARGQLEDLADYVNYISTDYSTTEQNTGRKWIDGKPIYQKTFSLNIIWTGDRSEIERWVDIADTPISNIDKMINNEVMGFDTADNTSNPSIVKHNAFFKYNLNNNCLSYYIANLYSFNIKAITVWYTKTTDSAAE